MANVEGQESNLYLPQRHDIGLHKEQLGHQCMAKGEKEEEVEEPIPVNALELRDIVISDLVKKGLAQSKQGAKSEAGPQTKRVSQEAAFISIPTNQVGGTVEVLEQMSQLENRTRQRILVFGLSRLTEEVFRPNLSFWEEHAQELGVLFHLHGKKRELSPDSFFLPPGDFSQAAIAKVDQLRQEQCSFQGAKFSRFHCESFVEVLNGQFDLHKKLPPLALESSVTDEAVRQHIASEKERLKARAFRVPLTVRLSQKSSWVYIRSRDKVKAEIELRGGQLGLFVGLWLTLQRLWHVQQSTAHPHDLSHKGPGALGSGGSAGSAGGGLKRTPSAPISVHVIESRDQMSVIRREFFFVVRPLKHLWARYLCQLQQYLSSFTKRNKLWVDFEKQALCLSVVIPSSDSSKSW